MLDASSLSIGGEASMPDETIPGALPPTQPILPAQTASWPVRFAHGMWAQVKMWRFWSTTLFVLAMAYILVVVRPFSGPPPTLSPDDISEQWNNSIQRLGLSALYPLQEDFQVGDIWAIALAPRKPSLTKSVRIDHIDLRHYIIEYENRPIF